jgi:hypothetical protein
VPIGKFQSEVLRSLAAQRSPDRYIAGGVAINRDGPRFSGDIVVPPASGMPGGGCGESYGPTYLTALRRTSYMWLEIALAEGYFRSTEWAQ